MYETNQKPYWEKVGDEIFVGPNSELAKVYKAFSAFQDLEVPPLTVVGECCFDGSLKEARDYICYEQQVKIVVAYFEPYDSMKKFMGTFLTSLDLEKKHSIDFDYSPFSPKATLVADLSDVLGYHEIQPNFRECTEGHDTVRSSEIIRKVRLKFIGRGLGMSKDSVRRLATDYFQKNTIFSI